MKGKSTDAMSPGIFFQGKITWKYGQFPLTFGVLDWSFPGKLPPNLDILISTMPLMLHYREGIKKAATL